MANLEEELVAGGVDMGRTWTLQGLIQDFLLGGGNHIFEIFLDIFGQQNRRIQ